MPGLLNTWLPGSVGCASGHAAWSAQTRSRGGDVAQHAVHETDEQLLDPQRRLGDLMERHRPHPEATAADHRRYFRIFDALFRVVDTRGQLRGLYAPPWRYDRWWRRDVPAVMCVPLQRRASQLGREARPAAVAVTSRGAAGAGTGGAAACPLALGDVDSLVSPAVRRLLEAG